MFLTAVFRFGQTGTESLTADRNSSSKQSVGIDVPPEFCHAAYVQQQHKWNPKDVLFKTSKCYIFSS